MLETTHTRDYYLSIAERHPLFESVITGDDSLVSWLDCIANDIGNVKEETPGRLEALCELCKGEVPSDEMFPHESLSKSIAWLMGYTIAGVYLPTFAGIAAITFIPPPLGELIGVPLLFGAPFSGFLSPIVGTWKRLDRLVEKRKKVLQPLYSIADSLDADISRCFIMEDFHEACGNRPRFEQTYRSLEPEERKAVDTQLLGYLAAGGMPGMDERQLKEYLGGLTERGMVPDA